MANSLVDKFTNKLIDWLVKDRPRMEEPICDFERLRYEIRPCDVLLIEGRSRVSEVIKLVTQSPWSHAALYIGRIHDIENPILRERLCEYTEYDPNEKFIIEGMLGRGTILAPLSTYKDEHIRICRPQGLSQKDAQRVIGYAIGRLGREYDIRHVFDLFRFLYPWSIMPRRWRSTLFQHHPGESTKEICSNLLGEAFASVKFPIVPELTKDDEQGLRLRQRNPRLLTPRDFDYSPYFQIIKYPIFELAQHALYRHLPWSEEDEHSNEEFTVEPNHGKSQVAAEDETAEEMQADEQEVTIEENSSLDENNKTEEK